MDRNIPINRQGTNAEVFARIVKAESQKYACDMKIDFHEGNRIAEFIGDETLMPFIVEDVKDIFVQR